VTAPITCPFCGAAEDPVICPPKRRLGKVTAYTCRTIHCPEWTRAYGMQSPQCVAAEVASLIRERDQLLARVERLEEAGDEMAAYEFLTDRLAEKWIEAKEAKP